MTKLPPDEFLNTDIGKIGNSASWNNIPTSQLKEYIPEGKSLEDQNKIKSTLREYYKRVNQVVFNRGGTGTGNFYTVPTNYFLLIDTIAISGSCDGTTSSAIAVNASNLSSVSIAYAGTRQAGPFGYSITFNNPLIMPEGTIISYSSAGAGTNNANYVITGWLEDKNINS